MYQTKDWLTEVELQKKLGVNNKTIKGWSKKGLSSYKVGKTIRYFDDEVNDFIRQKMVVVDSKGNKGTSKRKPKSVDAQKPPVAT